MPKEIKKKNEKKSHSTIRTTDLLRCGFLKEGDTLFYQNFKGSSILPILINSKRKLHPQAKFHLDSRE
jgi:hypothetical protein